MKYKLKTLTVSAKQWTGKNTDEVAAFLKENGFEMLMERRPDTDLFILIDNSTMRVARSEYITIDEKGAIATHSEAEFESFWEEAK